MVSQVLNDYTTADLSVKDRLMLDFTVRITLKPAGLNKNDIERLREVGFEDQDIVSVVLITCLFNFMNRVACSLGVEVPNSFHRTVGGWVTGPARQQHWLFHPEFWSHNPKGVSLWPSRTQPRKRPRRLAVLSRDSPDQTNFPGNSSFWDTVKYNPAFQGRQMRPDSLKFPVFI